MEDLEEDNITEFNGFSRKNSLVKSPMRRGSKMTSEFDGFKITLIGDKKSEEEKAKVLKSENSLFNLKKCPKDDINPIEDEEEEDDDEFFASVHPREKSKSYLDVKSKNLLYFVARGLGISTHDWKFRENPFKIESPDLIRTKSSQLLNLESQKEI
jgi:hypothetical protein